MLRFLSVALLLLGLYAALIPPPPRDAPVPLVLATAAGPQGVAQVIDGDSLRVGGTEVRLHGIDAPEARATCTGPDGRAYPCGRRATEAARALIGAPPVTCRDLGERTHGRVVAQCHAGGRDIAAALIAEGAVLACPRYAANHPHAAGYAALESRAAAAGLGLHAGQAPARARYCELAPVAAAGDCAIKGNINAEGQRIYHLPGQRHYAATRIDSARGERWFCSEDEAQAAGWRRARL